MEPIMKIKPISLNFGAEISGIDVRTITNDEFSRLYSAWLTYGVVRLRGPQPMRHTTLNTVLAEPASSDFGVSLVASGERLRDLVLDRSLGVLDRSR